MLIGGLRSGVVSELGLQGDILEASTAAELLIEDFAEWCSNARGACGNNFDIIFGPSHIQRTFTSSIPPCICRVVRST